MKKKLLIILGSVTAVIVVAMVILASNLGKIVESKKDYFLAQAKDRIGRDVTVDDVGVKVFPGIGVRLSNVSISEDPAFGGEPFVAAREVMVNVKLLPLLKKQVEVKRLVLHEPAIAIVRDENGRFNYHSIVEAAGGGGKVDEGQAAAAIPLVLAFADIKDGTVRFADRQGGGDFVFRDIDFTAKNVGLESEVSFDFRAAVFSESQDVRVEGKAGPIGSSDAADIAAAPIAVSGRIGPAPGRDIMRMLPPGPMMQRLRALRLGDIDAGFTLSGQLGELRVDELKVDAALFDAPQPNARFSMSAVGINAADPAALDPSAIEANGRLELSPLDLAAVREALGPAGLARPDLSLSGTASAEATFEGMLSKLSAACTFDATEAVMSIPETLNKPAGLPLRGSLEAKVENIAAGPDAQPRVSVTEFNLVFAELTASGSGTVVATSAGPRSNFTVSGGTGLSGWGAILPAIAVFAPTGKAAFDANVKQAPGAAPDLSGAVTLTDAGGSVAALPEPVKNASARITFAGRGATVEGASFAVGSSRMTLDASAANLKPLKATYRLQSDEVFRNDFNRPPEGKEPPRPEVLRKVAVSGNMWEHAPQDIRFDGRATSGSGTLSNVDYTDLSALIRSSKEVVVIDEFDAKSMGGSVEGKGTFHPSAQPPRFEIDASVKSIDLSEYFRYKSETLSNVLEGRIDMNLSLAGSGKTSEEVVPTLNGSGGGIVLNGSLLNVNIADEMIKGIESLPVVPPTFGKQMRAKYPKLFNDKKTVFEDLKGDVTISEGRMNTGNIFMKTTAFAIGGHGWISFDKKIDMNTTVVLSADLTRDVVNSVKEAKYLLNSNGLLEVPLRLSGDLMKPRPVIDSNALYARIQRSVVDDAVGNLKDEVKDLFSGFGKKKSEEKKSEEKKDE